MSDRTEHTKKSGTCAVTGEAMRTQDLFPLDQIHPSLAERIRADHPDLPAGAQIGRKTLTTYRMRYVEDLLDKETGEISDLERQVADSIAREETVAANIENEFAEKRTMGERLSDHLATFGGSWTFLITFFALLSGWIALNVVSGARDAFDPYPFILLNLVLSCIAAIQAPIIMMSQKRQEAKDRLRALNDYRVNLKAELEIRQLHDKLDHLISRQWKRLAEIQQLQLEIMQEHRH